jgi:hypothetical protein
MNSRGGEGERRDHHKQEKNVIPMGKMEISCGKIEKSGGQTKFCEETSKFQKNNDISRGGALIDTD